MHSDTTLATVTEALQVLDTMLQPSLGCATSISWHVLPDSSILSPFEQRGGQCVVPSKSNTSAGMEIGIR